MAMAVAGSFLSFKDILLTIPLNSITLSQDSLSAFLSLGSRVYYENDLTVTYKGYSVFSADSLPLAHLSEFQELNNSAGYPP